MIEVPQNYFLTSPTSLAQLNQTEIALFGKIHDGSLRNVEILTFNTTTRKFKKKVVLNVAMYPLWYDTTTMLCDNTVVGIYSFEFQGPLTLKMYTKGDTGFTTLQI